MRDFLASVCALDAILLGMCADIADDMLLLTRFCDSEDMDITLLTERVADCLSNLDALFGTRRECLRRPGYTRLMLALPRHPVVLTFRNQAKVFGCGTAAPKVAGKSRSRNSAWFLSDPAT